AIRFKSAKCIGERKTKPLVKLARELDVDLPPFRRGLLSLFLGAQVTATGDDIHIATSEHELSDALRFMLPIAVDRHQHVVMIGYGVIERRFERRAIAAVC